MVRRFFSFLFLLVFTFSFTAKAQQEASFDAEFDTGSLVRVITNEWAFDMDSLPYRNIVVAGRLDPANEFDKKAFRSNRWFYFKLAGIAGDSVRMEIKGSDPYRPFYSYDNENFYRFTENEFSERTLTKRFAADSVYIAYFIPYTYAMAEEAVDRWAQYSGFVDVIHIGYSAEGRPLQMLKITDQTTGEHGKKIVWIQSRTHPGETPSAFLLEGIVDRLLETESDGLLKNAVFYVIPMENPDGVVLGLSRSDALGIDHEGNYDSDPTETTVEVQAYKNYITGLYNNGTPVDLFLNLHAQTASKSSYWIHNPESTSEAMYRKKLKLFYNTVFYQQMKVSNADYNNIRSRVPEGWLWDEFGDRTVAVTLEVPYTHYSDRSMWVDGENLKEYGSDIVDALAAFLELETSRFVLVDNDKVRLRRPFKVMYGTSSLTSPLYYGNNYIEAQKRNKRLVYELDGVEQGTYSVYRWMTEDWKDDNARRANEKRGVHDTNKWEYVSTVTIDKPKRAKIKFKSSEKGEVFDMLMLRKEE